MDYLRINCVKWETSVPLEEHLCWLKCCIINGNEWYLCSPQFFLLCYEVSRVLIPERIILRTDTNDKITLTSEMTPSVMFQLYVLWWHLWLVFLRWPIRMVVFSLRLLLQKPQERARGWKRHFLQRALHFLFRDPIGSQLSAGNGHRASRHPPAQHPDSGPAGEKGSDSDSQEDWSAPRSKRRATWRHGGKEETGQREADSGAGAEEMHPGLPADSNSRALSREEEHVAVGALEKISALKWFPAGSPSLLVQHNRALSAYDDMIILCLSLIGSSV